MTGTTDAPEPRHPDLRDNAARLDADAMNAFWMPFTSNREFKAAPRMIVGATGCHYTAADGSQKYDTLSGLWCASFGHGRPEIARAIADTAQTLDYAPPFQYAHPLGFELANRVAELTPDGLDHIFFTNSGSESADTAIKIAKGYWARRGQPEKNHVIGRAKGYHGVNVGGTSVGGIAPNRAGFGALMDTHHLSHTLIEANRFSRGCPAEGAELADELLAQIHELGAERIAAVMVEPMSGSAGVVIPPQGYLERLARICRAHDILLIFDEVLTGFGRLGAMFGATLFGITPDILTMAKNITNGAVPMGAVAVTDAVHDAFMDSTPLDYDVEFRHGYTYSAHPLACAAGLAALDVLERDDLVGRAAALAPYFESQIHHLKGLRHIVDIRNLGLAGAFQIEPVPGEPGRRPWQIALAAWERGLYVRFGGDTVQLGPPFIAERADIDHICEVLADIITRTP
ncbi:aminotransferase class III-fold pyridoxal phosphate-dependent enzyme [Salinisphaera sp. Q1T1-3]|uniref:aminotransferase class III-fold pyridoxal phosphate-dependent enzyme n=1 Tax=Salinisphaera sp. Q1T1-3 TaxID=2321229 RepID=UPI000E764169|nr:aminotransferase class III-fold pyridoxal phosphate-dependent enzyme [Salinisphaera sp. Q1T1-3]RJS93304.1 aminotransferase class III-fold pyridoxal phosphate-dependent enzyme [Salinisphaera sp. Q1T1-3]